MPKRKRPAAALKSKKKQKIAPVEEKKVCYVIEGAKVISHQRAVPYVELSTARLMSDKTKACRFAIQLQLKALFDGEDPGEHWELYLSKLNYKALSEDTYTDPNSEHSLAWQVQAVELLEFPELKTIYAILMDVRREILDDGCGEVDQHIVQVREMAVDGFGPGTEILVKSQTNLSKC